MVRRSPHIRSLRVGAQWVAAEAAEKKVQRGQMRGRKGPRGTEGVAGAGSMDRTEAAWSEQGFCKPPH